MSINLWGGTTPASYSIAESTQTVQKALDSLLAPPYTGIPAPGMPVGAQRSYDGGVIQLPRGDFYGNLVLNVTNTILRGVGTGTCIHGSILVTAGYCQIEDMTILGTGQPYALKIYKAPIDVGAVQEAIGGVPRVSLRNLILGATAINTNDGPVATGGIGGHGLWMDGCIVCDAHKVIASFCPSSGVFIDTTSITGKWSTNVNKFFNCTANLNGRWGWELIGGGMLGNEWIGGNIESNGLTGVGADRGAVLAQNVNNLTIRGTDFEHGDPAPNLPVLINASGNPILIEDCNFVGDPIHSGNRPDRAVGIFTAVGAEVKNCRGAFINNRDWIGFDERCRGCRDGGGNISADGDDRFVLNKGMRY